MDEQAIIAAARASGRVGLDEAAGKASLFGGLSASGWHTAAIFIREIVTARMRTMSSWTSTRRPSEPRC